MTTETDHEEWHRQYPIADVDVPLLFSFDDIMQLRIAADYYVFAILGIPPDLVRNEHGSTYTTTKEQLRNRSGVSGVQADAECGVPAKVLLAKEEQDPKDSELPSSPPLLG